MSFSKNKFRKISSGVVLSGVGLCISLNSLRNVCSAGQTTVVKNSLSGLGAENLCEQTVNKVSDVAAGRGLLYFGAAVILCTAAVMI